MRDNRDAAAAKGGEDRSRVGAPANQQQRGPWMGWGAHPRIKTWAGADLNCRPHAYQACALTN